MAIPNIAIAVTIAIRIIFLTPLRIGYVHPYTALAVGTVEVVVKANDLAKAVTRIDLGANVGYAWCVVDYVIAVVIFRHVRHEYQLNTHDQPLLALLRSISIMETTTIAMARTETAAAMPMSNMSTPHLQCW